MSKFKCKDYGSTFKNARKGFRLGIKSEKNIRIHLFVGTLVLILGYLLNFTAVEYCLLLIAIALVVVSELLNTGIEFALDSVFHNRYSRLVGMAKDVSAGAVMFATFISIAIGIILFGNALLQLITR